MSVPPFDDVADVSLASDEAVLERVRDLVEGAYRQQLWFLFLDEHDRPGEEHADPLGPFVSSLVDEVAPYSVVVVLERPGGDELTIGDREWFAVEDLLGAG